MCYIFHGIYCIFYWIYYILSGIYYIFYGDMLHILWDIHVLHILWDIRHIPDSKVHGAHLGPTGPRWAPWWRYELCYLGFYGIYVYSMGYTAYFMGYTAYFMGYTAYFMGYTAYSMGYTGHVDLCKSVVTPLLMHWSYRSLALSHWYFLLCIWRWLQLYN